jgi:hypothetical protein
MWDRVSDPVSKLDPKGRGRDAAKA